MPDSVLQTGTVVKLLVKVILSKITNKIPLKRRKNYKYVRSPVIIQWPPVLRKRDLTLGSTFMKQSSIPELKTKCALRGYFPCFNIRNCKLKCWKIPTYFASPPKGTRFMNCQPTRKIRNKIRQQSIVIYAERYSKRTLPWFNDQYNT